MAGGNYNTTGVLKGPSGPSSAKADEASPEIVVTAAEISKLDALQMLLDVVGLIPGFGVRGDWLGAELSLFGAVPVAGEAATAGKIAKNADHDRMPLGWPEGREMIEAISLVSALGLPHSDGKVKNLLQVLGLQDKKIKLKRGDFDIAFDAPSHGVDVVFSDPAQHDLPETFPEGALVFSCVFFFSEGSQGHKAYQAPLPFSLRFEMPKAAVHGLLGQPEWTSPVLPIERWVIDGRQVAVSFADDGHAIDHLSVALPEV